MPKSMSHLVLRPFALTALLALGACSPMSSNAQTTPYVATDGTLLNVSAQGEAKRVPDIATISTGVVTRAPDANAAMRANARVVSTEQFDDFPGHGLARPHRLGRDRSCSRRQVRETHGRASLFRGHPLPQRQRDPSGHAPIAAGADPVGLGSAPRQRRFLR